MANFEEHEALRKVVAAAVADVITILRLLPDPIIIGGQYPDDKLLRAVAAWAHERNFSLSNPDTESWLKACQSGMVSGVDNDGSTILPD